MRENIKNQPGTSGSREIKQKFVKKIQKGLEIIQKLKSKIPRKNNDHV